MYFDANYQNITQKQMYLAKGPKKSIHNIQISPTLLRV